MYGVRVGVFARLTLAATVSLDAPAEAKKVKVPHVGKNVGKSVGKAARNAGRTIGNAARWGTNAVWVGAGLGATVTNNCTYYYKRYQETRDPKLRNKYNACIR
jgi:hypothetical protein